MLTDLSWLEEGKEFPPACEQPRLEHYADNERLFLTEHSEVWSSDFRRIARLSKKKNFDVETILNYHQLVSKKTADFVCGKPPSIETEGKTDDLTRTLDSLSFFGMLYEIILDISRYGNGIFKVIDKRCTVVSPKNWYPIVEPTDIKHIIHHVIAFPVQNAKQLHVEIHGAGYIEQRTHAFSGGRIGAMIGEPDIRKTNLDDFSVQVFSNLTHSSSIYGIDDYAIINSLVTKIMWRLHCADTILDKHSEPSMSGPETALQYDEQTSTWYLPLGNYFGRNNKDDPDMRYVTWDGNLESNFKEIETLFNQLYILSEMGQAFNDAGGVSDSSGTALRLRMVSPRTKANRLIGINTPAVKKMILMLAKLNDVPINYNDLTLHWNDGLPEDDVEKVTTLSKATGGKPIMSQFSAIKQRGLTDLETEAELSAIRQDDEIYNGGLGPYVDPPMDEDE